MKNLPLPTLDRILGLYVKGGTIPEIAKRTKVEERVIRAYLRKYDLLEEFRGPCLPQSKINRILELHAQNLPNKKISDLTKVDTLTIRKYLHLNGLQANGHQPFTRANSPLAKERIRRGWTLKEVVLKLREMNLWNGNETPLSALEHGHNGGTKLLDALCTLYGKTEEALLPPETLKSPLKRKMVKIRQGKICCLAAPLLVGNTRGVDNPEEVLVARDLVREVFERLDVDTREILTLRFIEGYEVNEIAELRGYFSPVEGSKRVTQALRAFRRSLMEKDRALFPGLPALKKDDQEPAPLRTRLPRARRSPSVAACPSSAS